MSALLPARMTIETQLNMPLTALHCVGSGILRYVVVGKQIQLTGHVVSRVDRPDTLRHEKLSTITQTVTNAHVLGKCTVSVER